MPANYPRNAPGASVTSTENQSAAQAARTVTAVRPGNEDSARIEVLGQFARMFGNQGFGFVVSHEPAVFHNLSDSVNASSTGRILIPVANSFLGDRMQLLRGARRYR